MIWLDGHSPTIVCGACYLALIVFGLLAAAVNAWAAWVKGRHE